MTSPSPELLFRDPFTGKLQPIERVPFSDFIFHPESNANFIISLQRRIAELEQRGG